MLSCPACGRDVSEQDRACGSCGATLTPEAPVSEVRRRVTIVTSDLKGSTSLGERLDPESLREVLTLYFDEMRAVLEARGGTIEKIIGDAIVAVFGLPSPRDDDALRAVRAAAETRVALEDLNERLERAWGVRLVNRTGVATGELAVGEASAGEHILTGNVVNLANKLEQSAPAQEVLIGEPTFRLVARDVTVEPVDPVLPKDAVEAIAAYRLVAVAPEVRGSEGGGLGTPQDAATRARVAETRKTVTVVFSDLKATTSRGDPLAPEVLRDVMGRAFDRARGSLEHHGGTVEKFIGDAVMAVFGLPIRHEDDGLRAVRAALEMRENLSNLAGQLLRENAIRLEVAIGVNTGEVVAGDASLGQRLVTGDAVNVAARLEQAAPVHEVYIGELTFGLVRDAVEVVEVEPLTLKGKAKPVAAYRLVAVRSGEGSARREDTPMVGREAEMRLLGAAFQASLRTRECHLVTVVGEAGVGKTRLIKEFIDSVSADARVLRGRCLPYGDGITFWPIAEVVREASGIRDDDSPAVATRRIAELVSDDGDAIVERVASAIGLSPAPFQVAELLWGIRRFLESLARDEPVLILIDDIHWAEPTLLELIRTMVDAAGAPIVLLCTSRHGLLDEEPEWATRSRETRIILQPLTEADAGLVVEHLLGQAGLADAVRARIVGAAEGNPLFVEQLLSMLIDKGSLRLEGDSWIATSDLSELAIPPTIHALLASRLDQLPGPERAVVEPASVIGLNFAPSAVRELAVEEVRDDLWPHLGSLVRRQLVREGEARSEVDPSYRFQHILVRDAAYQGLLKRSRATLHERFVEWADRVNAEAGRAQEFEEILGYHLEQAYRYRRELGPLGDDGVALGVRASTRLGSAGARAFARGDMPAAASLLERAAALLPEDHATRPGLLLRLGEARMEMGDYEAADRILDDSARAAAAGAREGLETSARLTRLMFRYLTDPAGVEGDVEAQVQDAISVLERTGDQEGLVTAWRFITNLRIGATQWDATEQAVERWIHHARESGDRVTELRAGPILAMAALFGPMPVPEAIARCEDLLSRSAGDRKAEATILRDLARLQAMEGRFDAARNGYRRARASLEELGWTNQATLTSLDSGPIELLAGNPEGAEAELRRDYETLDRLGERNFITTIAAMLADAIYRQGRYGEADTFAAFSAAVAAPDDNSTQYMWRAVRAKLLAREGRSDEALEHATAAVALTRMSDDLTDQANALLDLAEVTFLAGRQGEALAAATESVGLCERKGELRWRHARARGKRWDRARHRRPVRGIPA